MTSYDLVVIGSGPGGYVAAVKAAQNGKKTAVIERNQIGGTCLNVGCIPSKSYIQHAHWVLAGQEAAKFGFTKQEVSFEFPKLVARKDQVVKKLKGGIHGLFKANRVDYIEGEASFENSKLMVNGKKIGYQDLLLATGSSPFVPPINGVDQADYLTTDTFFKQTEFPKQLTIIGGGVIAVELAFAMHPLGSEVTLIEVAPDILLTEDEEARKVVKSQLQKMGIKIYTQAKITEVKKDAVVLDEVVVPFEKLLVATGRRADLTLAKQLGLELDERQRFVKVDCHYRTSQPRVYAIGDLVGGYQLAHAASAEGLCAVAAICDKDKHTLDQTSIPRCLYTQPEVASFGLSLEQAKERYENVQVKKMAFASNGKAIASEETNGFVKIIIEGKYQQILGAVIVGAHATEMIHAILAVKESEGTIDEIARMVFAHPTLSETISDVAKSF